MKRAALVVVATGLVALGLPATQAAAEEKSAELLGGYSLSAISTPIRVELYEPLVPIPANPQFELNIAYSKAVTSSGPASKGRASWAWPGDPVGEGLKTFADQLGIPSNPLTDGGYQVQVNSEYPGDTTSQSDEPFPGTIMRTTADTERTVSKAGFAVSGDVREDKGKGDGDGEGDQGGGDMPGLPELPGLPALQGAVKSLTGGSTRAAAEEEPAMPGLGALAAVVDAAGVSSVSRTEYGDDASVTATGLTRIGELRLLDGLITAESIKVMSSTTSTLTDSKSTNDVLVGGLAVAGVPFGFDGDGAVVGGEKQEIPGLPDDPAKALEALGVSFGLPTATKSQDGGAGEQAVRGLTVEIDLGVLLSKIDTAPVDSLLGQITQQLPDELGPVKSLLGAGTQARPRVVVVLGDVATEASTVEPFEFDSGAGDVPTPQDEPPAVASGDGPAVGNLGGASTSGGDLPVTASGEISGEVPAGDGAVTAPLQNAGAGLPPLGSIPGALMVGGLALAGVLGWWMQKMGGLVLGGATACSHGLASGVPDLRKA